MKKYIAFAKSWYLEDKEFKPYTVNEIEIARETPQKFSYKNNLIPKVYNGHYGRFDEYHSLHDTYEEAFEALTDYLNRLIEKGWNLIAETKTEIAGFTGNLEALEIEKRRRLN